jgi:hypothetical protein
MPVPLSLPAKCLPSGSQTTRTSSTPLKGCSWLTDYCWQETPNNMKPKLPSLLTLLALTTLPLLTSGCRSVELTLADGSRFKSTSFGNKLSIGEVALKKDGSLSVKGYNLDQVQGLGVVAESIAKGVASGLTPTP